MGKIGDIWVRLGLKKNDFDTGLKKADSDLKGFGTGVGKMGSVAGAALKGIAGAAGLAVGGIEAFNRMITSNESNNDKWENTMRAMNNVVNEFFTALSTGDFTGFQNGLDGIVRKARETAEALRQIDDAQTVYGLFSSRNRAEFNEALVTIRDKNASPEAVAEAKKSIEDIIAKQEEQSGVLSGKAINAVKSMLSQRGTTDATEWTEEDILDMLSIAIDAQGGSRSEVLEAQAKEYKKQFRELTKSLQAAQSRLRQGIGSTVSNKIEIDSLTGQLAALPEQYKMARFYDAVWNRTNGKELDQLVSYLQSAYAARSEIASMQRTYNRATQTTTGLGGKDEIPAAKGSIAWYGQKIKILQEKIASTTDATARATAQQFVDEYKKKIEELQYHADFMSALNRGQIGEFISGENLGITEADLAAPELDMGKIDLSGTDAILKKQLDVEQISKMSEGMEEYRSQIDETSDSIGILAGAMSNLSGLVDEQAASWMSYAGNVIQAIAQAIPAIAALTSAKNAEATAGAASAASQAGSAVAGIPYVGPVMAVAAIASVIAALAAVPKFAQGGIVGGSSYYGDKILARVNSGEMILNTDQQRRIFNHMESPVQRVEITGRMTASGRDLQYIFDKYGDYRRQ